MDIQASKIARKYAQSFLNSSPCSLTLQEYESLYCAVQSLKSSGRLSTLLKLSLLSTAFKKQELLTWFDALSVSCNIAPLLDLLAEHQRLFLFVSVLEQLCTEYAVKNGIINVQVQSACKLDSDQCQDISEFLTRALGKRVSTTFVVKKKIIAGIRLQGINFLWEHSLRQRLHACARKIA